MRRGLSAFVLGACAVCCGQTGAIGSQKSGELDASASGGAVSSGGAPAAGGSVQSGGHFGSGGMHGLGATGGGGTGGADDTRPPVPPWVYAPEGGTPEGGVCPAIPGAIQYECWERPGQGPTTTCSLYFEHLQPQIQGPGRYDVGCRLALPERATTGCGPRICVCARNPPDAERPEWQCPPRPSAE